VSAHWPAIRLRFGCDMFATRFERESRPPRQTQPVIGLPIGIDCLFSCSGGIARATHRHTFRTGGPV
jgi:hypothetical protein